MSLEEHDDLWQLLGKAKQPHISPAFVQNVVREVRRGPTQLSTTLRLLNASKTLWDACLHQWRHGLLAVCTICAAIFLIQKEVTFNRQQEAEKVELFAMELHVSESPDYQVISHLDELLASEENSVWLENSTSSSAF